MFNVLHPQPVVSRRAVPVLAVQQAARPQALGETVLVALAPEAGAPPSVAVLPEPAQPRTP